MAECDIIVSDTLKTLGVKLDSTLTFEEHVTDIVRTCNLHIRALRQIRRGLTQKVANTMACSIVGSHIDSCNSLPYGTSDKVINKLQLVLTLGHMWFAMSANVTNTPQIWFVDFTAWRLEAGSPSKLPHFVSKRIGTINLAI